jgi:HEAT repeat protein
MASSRDDSEYSAALKELGPRAVPFIFRKLNQNDSPWRNKYRDIWPKLPGFFQKHLPKPKPITFEVWRAWMALNYCGTNATRMIINRLNDGNPAVREAAWDAVDSFDRSSISTNEIISLCLPALKDNVAMVRLRAARQLGRMGAAASNAVPAIIPLLSSSEAGRSPSGHVYVRANSALALGSIGPAASNAVPALTNLMVIGDGYTRVAAAFALWRITSNENLSLPVIMKELPTLGKPLNNKQLPINALKAMGPRAKAAFPLLLSELPLAADDIQRGLITNALKAIDPEAAAKAGIK